MSKKVQNSSGKKTVNNKGEMQNEGSASRSAQRNSGTHNTRRGKGGTSKPRRTTKEDIRYTDLSSKVRGDSSTYRGTDPNDGFWYNHLPDVLIDAASISFPTQLGSRFPIAKPGFSAKLGSTSFTAGSSYTQQPNWGTNGVTYPGVMRIQYMPTVGEAGDPTSAINRAATQIYTEMRSKLSSKVKNYSKTNVMMMIIGVTSAYTLFNILSRVYKIMINRDWQSKYIPNQLLRALGFAPDLASKRSQFKDILDRFAYDLSVFPLPKSFDYISRQLWLSSGVYADVKEISKAQLYVTQPAGFYRYVETAEDIPSYLEYVTFAKLFGQENVIDPVIETLTDISNAIDTLMKPLLGSSDIGLIIGDVMDVFGGNLINIVIPDASSPLEVSYSEEVLEQIQNMVNVNGYTKTNTTGQHFNDIVEYMDDLVAGSYLTQNLKIYAATNDNQSIEITGSGGDITVPSHLLHSATNYVYNTVLRNPSPIDIAVGTRFNCGYTLSGNEAIPEIVMNYYGTEIVLNVTIYFNTVNSKGYVNEDIGTLNVQSYNLIPLQKESTTVAGILANSIAVETDILVRNLLSTFDHAPTQYSACVPVDGTPQTVELLGIFTNSQIENFTTIDDETLKRIHDACVISEFFPL